MLFRSYGRSIGIVGRLVGLLVGYISRVCLACNWKLRIVQNFDCQLVLLTYTNCWHLQNLLQLHLDFLGIAIWSLTSEYVLARLLPTELLIDTCRRRWRLCPVVGRYALIKNKTNLSYVSCTIYTTTLIYDKNN